MKYKKFFLQALLRWNEQENSREMPWKGEKDPYKIWISEIILQQTRVQQGMAYYTRFITRWPHITALAGAPEKEVYKLWEGLGYYSRCRNIIASAKFINDELAGKFPEKYEDIRALRGIGDYTASAIASFAFNLPHAVVDGNVFRVLARFFGIGEPVDTTAGKKMFASLARELIDKSQAGIYNQAIMDFGAVICKPAQPLCDGCPLQKKCVAYDTSMVGSLPVKEKNILRRERFFTYLVVDFQGKTYVRKRTEKDIWQNLYEFILVETPSLSSPAKILSNEKVAALLPKNQYSVLRISPPASQQLTHQTITGRFFHISAQAPLHLPLGYELLSAKDLGLLPFPKFITSYLKD
jgi:A/G-specific adenine glycosylase